MKVKIPVLTLVFLTFFINVLHSQQPLKSPNWQKWDYLMGKWKADNQGDAAKGEGFFIFSTELDKNILVRKNILVFPAAPGKPEMKHEDLLVVYPGKMEDEFKAEYWDNESHVMHYTVSFGPEGNILFVSDLLPGQPRFRLTYIKVDPAHVSVKFEIASPANPGVYNTYMEGKAVKADN
jgi:hypothetical protein